MVGDDRSDILSGDKLPVGRYQPPSYWSTLSGATKVSLYFVTFLLIAFSVRTFHHRFLRWRETNYRKATRRRHGIPDTDNRPFNVAYAAAVTARKENEARKNLQLRQRTLEEASPAPSPTRRSFGLDARQITSVPGGLGSYPIRSPSVAGRVRSSLGPTYGQQSHLHPINALTGRQDNISASSNRSNRSTPRKTSRPQTSSPVVHPQPLDDEGENSAVEVVEQPAEESFSEGAPQSDEDHQMEVEGGSIVPARGAKRLASPDDEDEFDDTFVTQRRDKRARKISREHPPIPEDDVMVDADADIMDESHTSPRGKKRDRGDAASTFGGDEDSLIDDSDDKHKRNRRRRTVSTRKPRGQKRGRESHAFESGSDEEVEFSSTRGSRKKRGKKAVAQEDTSFFEPPYSTDPLCKGRRVGEEWEIGGTKYKVGPNGDRLQQALVKRKRPKYKMPSDSQHPDKDVMIEVVVEAWLTEDEYKLAKERFELAWQDPPPNVDIEMETPSEPQTPVKGGKALLWASTTSHADSPLPERRPFRHSITTNVGLPLPTSPQLRTPGKGRISTPVYSPAAVGLDSPRLKHVKSFSKWEKQDMEAEAMLKIRQKLQESKKVVEDEKKPSPSPAPTLVTTSTTTTVAQSLTTPAPATPMQPKPATSTPTVTETKEPAKNLFTTPTPVPTPSTTVPAPAQPAIPNFFAKPTTTTPPAPATKPEPPATTTSTMVPNFFSKSAVPPPSATTSTPVSAFSIPTTQPTPTAGTSTTKPMFTFPGLGNAGSGPSPFSVPKPAEQPKQPQPTATLTPVPNVPSLGARLGPQVTNAPTPVPTTTKPASTLSTAAATTTTSAPEPPKPADNTPKFTFGFKPAPTPATSSTPTTTPVQQTTTTAVPQFGKTGQSQPALSPFGTTGQPQSTPSPFGTTGQSQPAPSPFGTTGQSQSTPSPFGTTNHSQSTSSPFGTTGQLQHTPSPFGTTRQSQQPPSLPENASQSKPTPSPFGTSNQSKSAPSPFGATNQTQPAPSPFGITNQSQPTPSPFGATSQSQPAPSPFGATSQSQPAPSPFGATSQPTPPVSGTQPAPPKPASQPTQPSFNFPTNKPPGASDPRVTFPSTTPATTGTPPSVFSFPPSKLDTSKPGPSPLRNGSVFGATPTPTSAFPMTTSTSTTLPTPVPATDKPTFSFNFPNTPNTTTANETIGSKASPFVFTPVTPSTSTGGGAPSPFNFSGIAQGQNGTTPAAFGFGAPNPGAFSFGKPEEKK